MKDRVYIKDLKEHTGKEVVIAGWVDVRRDQGKMVFFDMRDMSGKVQCVALPSKAEVPIPTEVVDRGSSAMEIAGKIRPEWVLKVSGIVNKRPEKNVNAGVLNGDVELEAVKIEVLNQAITPPFQINENTIGINEDVRMKYKYLDLRTERMHKNIRMRDKIITFFRKHMH